MTRKELYVKLKSGSKMEDLFHFTNGQNGPIYKAEISDEGEDIIYIPDIVQYGIPIDRPLESLEEICSVIFVCYTGSDFVVQCGGNRNLARKLFQNCSGQHPAEGLKEIKSFKEPLFEQVHITIFQAPFAALVEKGVYWEMNNPAKPFSGNVPTEYYLAVFNGKIDCPEELPEDPDQRRLAILEHVFSIFNTAHPDGYAGRSLSVGDIVLLEGQNYLCVASGFVPVAFECGKDSTAVSAPRVCEITLPDGTKLQASAHDDTDYPGINIYLFSADGKRELICFAEHNPEKPLGYQLCIGAYQAGEDEPCYYDSYNKKC